MSVAPLGEDLTHLVAEHGAPLLDAEPVSPLRGPHATRAAFRLRFGDGVVLKGRRIETRQQAGTVWAMSQALRAAWPRAPLSRVQAWRGDALLEQWLPGTPLDAASVRDADLRKAGLLLGRLHCGVPEVLDARRTVDEAWIARSLDIAPLVAANVVDPKTAETAVSIARAHRPARAAWGWCHGDFCGENLLRVPRRGLHLIDNETIGEHWFDHDLARTWYRWALAPEAWAVFLAGYAEIRSPRAFERHFGFWAVCVLLRAAVFRLRQGLAPDAALARLQRLCVTRGSA